MKFKISILRFILNNRWAIFISILFISAAYCSLKFSLENKYLLRKYSKLENNINYHSAVAERLKLRAVSFYDRKNISIKEIENRIALFFNENDISSKLYLLEQDSVLVKIESAKLFKLLDVLFLLSSDKTIIISKVDISISKNLGYVSGEIILQLSQGI
ncbi:Uncharacterised protein [Yersinia frederiksenii]|uniref:General secretion pathway protein GspM n=2 Tax=Yersinia frederiksenii TaxID=29484 RepID=A0A380PV46_YERFR|nr:hypothetical protein CRN75_04100 [Yersinia frederiksenii]KGA48873.1 hypothetical protein DJ58_4006 [Yersinia frederiksenii ATCC 33641]CFR06480.1 Uncharacterised protein [Yersinia frederiksenii]CNF80159.1 Uncharacterised protein [Yersinia frederiksenii]SUP76827.1 Uncharacterised protein [Yersinia frederiksenii]